MARREALGAAENSLRQVRAEITVMPRFNYHQPLDYHLETFPPKFEEPVKIPGVLLPLPPPPTRMGYPADNSQYLEMGRYDHDLIMEIIARHGATKDNVSILDFGCSSGRVLRHFDEERRHRGWRVYGCDIQALPIEWMRRNFPKEFCVFTTSTMPHLQLADSSVDVIYGISVFTHTKFLWDAWLMELRRVLRPGGLLIQTIHTESAWRFYHNNRNEQWVRENHSATMLQSAEMTTDYFYFGDAVVSQVFWKREIAREFWSRYFDVIEIRDPPPKFSFQDWVICRKS